MSYNKNNQNNNYQPDPNNIFEGNKRSYHAKTIYRVTDNQNSLLEIVLVFDEYNNYEINLIITPINPNCKGTYPKPLAQNEKKWCHKFEIWMRMNNQETHKLIKYLKWYKENGAKTNFSASFSKIERNYGIKSIEKIRERNYAQNNSRVEDIVSIKDLYLGYGSINSSNVNIASKSVTFADLDHNGNAANMDNYLYSIALYLQKRNIKIDNPTQNLDTEGYFFHFVPEMVYFPDGSYELLYTDLDMFIKTLEDSLFNKSSSINSYTSRALFRSNAKNNNNQGNNNYTRPEQALPPSQVPNGITGMNNTVQQSMTPQHTLPPMSSNNQFANTFNGTLNNSNTIGNNNGGFGDINDDIGSMF